jgi:hypothetical protein
MTLEFFGYVLRLCAAIAMVMGTIGAVVIALTWAAMAIGIPVV